MEFYDVGSSDLRELWESYLAEPILSQDWIMGYKDDDWGNMINVKDKTTLGVVLRDRLMTDAALGGPRPIKSEHSYSLSAYSPPASPVAPEENSYIPNSEAGSIENRSTTSNADPNHKPLALGPKIDDMEEECFPAIAMNKASSRDQASPSSPQIKSSSLVSSTTSLNINQDQIIQQSELEIKDEPMEDTNCPSPSYDQQQNFVFDQNTITMISPQTLNSTSNKRPHSSDSEEEEDDYYQSLAELEEAETQHSGSEDGRSHQSLPPTPPSSASSDSEGTASSSCSPERRNSHSSPHIHNIRGLLTPRVYITNSAGHSHSSRHPIHTSLISCQPKGSTGLLMLTEEEKRTLIAEGYPVPTKLPLTKQEEKSLKKVRRKIKNKISAQESRRKKKEYMDGLERRVTMLTNENSSYRDRLSTLEDTNRGLLKELERLQALVERRYS